jgi:hypothetical protein
LLISSGWFSSAPVSAIRSTPSFFPCSVLLFTYLNIVFPVRVRRAAMATRRISAFASPTLPWSSHLVEFLVSALIAYFEFLSMYRSGISGFLSAVISIALSSAALFFWGRNCGKRHRDLFLESSVLSKTPAPARAEVVPRSSVDQPWGLGLCSGFGFVATSLDASPFVKTWRISLGASVRAERTGSIRWYRCLSG